MGCSNEKEEKCEYTHKQCGGVILFRHGSEFFNIDTQQYCPLYNKATEQFLEEQKLKTPSEFELKIKEKLGIPQ